MWTEAICRRTIGRTNKHPNAKKSGDHKFSLTAFRHTGYDANWLHVVELSKKAHGQCWKVDGCSCGTIHKATMKLLQDGVPVVFTSQIVLGMAVCDEFRIVFCLHILKC
jgi:hypothetical protein